MLQGKILDTIKKFNLLSSRDKVLIGVSGGPDSLALLFLLNDLKVKLGIKIIVAHLNHGIRGRAADLDEKFVKGISGKLRVDFFSKKIGCFNSRKPNEEMLRNARYNFLFDIAKKYSINTIALAHTQDDQAETVLMRLIRGTGLHGLISISPKRKINSFVIIRPLIEVTRKEVEKYLKSISVKPRIDRTNFNNKFLRNRIRHGVLKDLTRLNPKIKQTLANFSQQAAVDYDYLNQQANKLLSHNNGSLIKIELEKINNLHVAMQRMVVRVALESIAGNLRAFTNKHWQEIEHLIKVRPEGSLVYLAKGIRVKKERRHISIYQIAKK